MAYPDCHLVRATASQLMTAYLLSDPGYAMLVANAPSASNILLFKTVPTLNLDSEHPLVLHRICCDAPAGERKEGRHGRQHCHHAV
jgi:hypothetical protein